MVVLVLNQWRMDKPKHEDFKKVVEAAGLKKAAALKSVGKNALKGVNKKCKVLAPKGKAASYKKMFKNKGQAKTVKVK